MTNSRARNWLYVFYPESCPVEWEEVIESWGVTCYVSPLHDLDVRRDGTVKKPHYHGVLTFEGLKSYGQVMELVSQLGCSTALICNSVRNALRYLCHMDNPDKVQYESGKIKTFGCCDLSACYVQTASEETANVAEIINIARQYNIYEFADLTEFILDNFSDSLFPTLKANHSFIRSFCQSMYMRKR